MGEARLLSLKVRSGGPGLLSPDTREAHEDWEYGELGSALDMGAWRQGGQGGGCGGGWGKESIGRGLGLTSARAESRGGDERRQATGV